MSEIRLCKVTKTFDRKRTVIEDLDLVVPANSFTVLVGPSGCGKTTALRMIAGLEEPSSGRILIDGEDVTDLAPGDRGIAMVFQNYAVYPHMTVRENVEFGLRNARVPAAERRSTVDETLELVGLADYAQSKPAKLSGGQRQRVALARAISKRPRVFLMDEPLSNLDATLREQMRTELVELHRRLGSTFVFVTHDQLEAMTMGDRIVVMDKGAILQEGSPREIYHDPLSVAVARFIGDPGMNVLRLEDGRFFGFRPRAASISGLGGGEGVEIPGQVVAKEVLGSELLYCVETSFGRAMVKTLDDTRDFGDETRIGIRRPQLYFFDGYGARICAEKDCALLYGVIAGAYARPA